MLQCDFSYMIGPAMFDEFASPELARTCRRLANPFYHLDGPGELPHFDSLLAIPELKGVPWIPGAGQPPYIEWPEVYRRIRAAGKRAQFYGTAADLETLVSRTGDARGLCLIGAIAPEDERFTRDILRRHGADA